MKTLNGWYFQTLNLRSHVKIAPVWLLMTIVPL